MVHVITGLQHLHGHGVMHRDLKPPNILVRRLSSGYLLLKIADFGLARVLKESSARDARLSIKGSPFYMAPEVPSMEYTCNVDVYSFAVAMCEVLARAVEVPGAETIAERAEAVSAAMNHSSGKPAALIGIVSSLLSSSFDKDAVPIRDFLQKCMEPASGRLTSADALRVLQGMPMWKATSRAVYRSASKLIR
jgi:serine/threonine protein kinase